MKNDRHGFPLPLRRSPLPGFPSLRRPQPSPSSNSARPPLPGEQPPRRRRHKLQRQHPRLHPSGPLLRRSRQPSRLLRPPRRPRLRVPPIRRLDIRLLQDRLPLRTRRHRRLQLPSGRRPRLLDLRRLRPPLALRLRPPRRRIRLLDRRLRPLRLRCTSRRARGGGANDAAHGQDRQRHDQRHHLPAPARPPQALDRQPHRLRRRRGQYVPRTPRIKNWAVVLGCVGVVVRQLLRRGILVPEIAGECDHGAGWDGRGAQCGGVCEPGVWADGEAVCG